MLLLYAATIFLSAFLLFAVQPMIGKMILPWFGGSASVWNTCLLFFQVALLAGYLYAHWLNRYLKPRRQMIVHVVLLAASLAVLPILPSPFWKPTAAGDPSGRILLLLAATIGLPYLLLSTTGPLLQAWFAAAKPGSTPYRLYALSNLGSLLALFSFPVLIEPWFSTHEQGYSWSAVYAAFVALCSAVAWRRRHEPIGHVDGAIAVAEKDEAAPGWKRHLLWIFLPACASGLLVSFTNHLSQNVAPIPFLWVLTLGVYLLSFIICFEREAWYRRAVFLPLLALASGGAAFSLYYDQGNLRIKYAIPVFVITLFVCCMVCHGELARLKPNPRRLTNFYLMLSFGGALGGVFVAIVAPRLFNTYVEPPVLLACCPALAAIVLWQEPGTWTSQRRLNVVRVLMVLLTATVGDYLIYAKHKDDLRFRMSLRNFYGVLRVYDGGGGEDEPAERELVHGTISHGSQILDPGLRRTPTSYYGVWSGWGRAVKYVQKHAAARVGMVGLGAGVSAAYGRSGDLFQFYEINPLDYAIATTWFTYLRDCSAEHPVLFGDARLTMEQLPSQQLDLLGLDAFASDSIPVHLLTREAFALYFRHLKPGGILAVHVSNRYLNLTPIVALNARDLGKASLLVTDDGEEESYLTSSDWVLVTADPAVFAHSEFQSSGSERVNPKPGLRPWTDDFSNLYQILK